MNLLESLSQMPTRDHIGRVLNQFGLTGSAAEVGVLWGGYTAIVLKEWNGRAYWCVDLWAPQDARIYREKTDDMDYGKCYQQVQELATRDKRIIVARGLSHAVATMVPDDCLDFAFIDANHAYQAVLDDMETWWRKVKKGGVMGGHDYCRNTEWPNFCEVIPAVPDWMREHAVDFVTDKGEGQGKSWWSVKL